MKVGVIIQARVGSTRLPGKVLMEIKGKKVLEHVVERVKLAKLVDTVIIATTTSENDDKLADLAISNNWLLHRGSEDDVLSRYYEAAQKYHLDVIVRITSDCPLIDPNVINDMIDFYINHDYQMISNAGADLSKRTFPRGLDVEIFSIDALRNAYLNAKEQYQREHVTPFIYENYNEVFYYLNDLDYSKYRWTLDTEEDWKLINKIYQYLYNGEHSFFLRDIIKLMNEKPELVEINANVEQKKLK